MRDDDNERAEGYPGPLDLPDGHGAPDTDEPEARQFSLTDDVLALFEDGKTYAEAELRFQKSRAGFVGNRVKTISLVVIGLIMLRLLKGRIDDIRDAFEGDDE